jgi:hypothetical protein
MIVVAETSPLNYLIPISEIEILAKMNRTPCEEMRLECCPRSARGERRLPSRRAKG